MKMNLEEKEKRTTVLYPNCLTIGDKKTIGPIVWNGGNLAVDSFTRRSPSSFDRQVTAVPSVVPQLLE